MFQQEGKDLTLPVFVYLTSSDIARFILVKCCQDKSNCHGNRYRLGNLSSLRPCWDVSVDVRYKSLCRVSNLQILFIESSNLNTNSLFKVPIFGTEVDVQIKLASVCCFKSLCLSPLS